MTLKELLAKKKMTQAELARRINVSTFTVNQWVNYTFNPDLKTLQKLAEILGKKVYSIK
jgi:DNA-binding XRE family transcriptional regulator